MMMVSRCLSTNCLFYFNKILSIVFYIIRLQELQGKYISSVFDKNCIGKQYALTGASYEHNSVNYQYDSETGKLMPKGQSICSDKQENCPDPDVDVNFFFLFCAGNRKFCAYLMYFFLSLSLLIH